MAYSNSVKLANGATVTINGTAYEDAISIGVPGNVVELVDITTLGSTRKEYTPSDMPDTDEIVVTLPFTGTYPAIAVAGAAAVACSVYLPKISKTISFSGFVTKVQPGVAEIDGKLTMEVTIKPTTAAS